MKEKLLQIEPVKYLQLPFSSNTKRQGDGEEEGDLNKDLENSGEQNGSICLPLFPPGFCISLDYYPSNSMDKVGLVIIDMV